MKFANGPPRATTLGAGGRAVLELQMHAVMVLLWPVLRGVMRGHATTTENIGLAMLRVARAGHASRRLENTDIDRLRKGLVGGQFWSVYIPGDYKDSGFARVQLEHRTVPEHRFHGAATQDQPRPPGARLTARPNRPAATHPQVRSQHDSAREAKEQVLSDRLDVLQPPSVETVDGDRCPRARMGRLDLERLADDRLQAARSPVDGVALGHR